jgi:hypothetical protein
MVRQLNRPARLAGVAALMTITMAAGAPPAWSSAGTVAAARSAAPACRPLTAFHRGAFTRSTTINNKWFPLVPGTQFVYQGRANTGGVTLPHTVVFTVTDMVKVVNGVRTRVLWDQDFDEGELVEAELAFHAQDRRGNVWNLGEYPEEYDNGRFTGSPNTWISGVGRARGGVVVPGKPRVGTPAFLEGSSPAIDFLDCGKVIQLHQRVCVPVGCRNNVLVVDETSPLEPDGGHQRKYYAPGVGTVQVGAVGDPEGETLVLISVRRLNASAMAQVRAAVRALERRAYRVSAAYRHTPPAHRGR